MNTDLLKQGTWYLYTERNGWSKLNEIKKGLIKNGDQLLIKEKGEEIVLKLCIVKWGFWIQIKFITEDSNAIHTIITTR